MIQPGLCIKKQTAFIPTKKYFYIKKELILYDTERKVVELV